MSHVTLPCTCVHPRDGYGLLTVVAITIFAFISSCCAIVSTRAFLVTENCDARRSDSVLGMHERRHRLLQSLHSLGGRPSATPKFRPNARVNKPWRQLVIDSPLEGDRLGVNLTEDRRECSRSSRADVILSMCHDTVCRTPSSSQASQTLELKLSGLRLPQGTWCSRHSPFLARHVGRWAIESCISMACRYFSSWTFFKFFQARVQSWALGSSRQGKVVCGCIPGAMRDFHRLKQPIVVTTVDPTPWPRTLRM